MKDYTVSFTIFGKGFKITVLAASKSAADIVLRNKIAANTKVLKIDTKLNDVEKLLGGFKK